MRRLLGTLTAAALAVTGLATTGSTPAAAATGSFNVLTYNIAGLLSASATATRRPTPR